MENISKLVSKEGTTPFSPKHFKDPIYLLYSLKHLGRKREECNV
jgi:hypothetical protein